MNLGFIALVAVAVLIISPLSRLVVAAVFGKAIGKAALDKQPDIITLERTDPAKLRNATRVQAVADEFRRSGFESAGTYTIREMLGVHVELLAHRDDSMAGAIYDHPAVGVFYDVISRYVDGATCTYTTARITGIKRPPNARTVNVPEALPTALIEEARRDRPQQGLRSCSTSSVVSDFVAAYGEYMAWMKHRGVSTSEVMEVAKRKAA